MNVENQEVVNNEDQIPTPEELEGIEVDLEVDGEENMFESLEDLVSYEMEARTDAEECLEWADEAYQSMSPNLEEEIIAKAREIIEVINPELATDIEGGDLFISHKDPQNFYFGVCVGDHDKAGHNHSMVVVVPVVALLLNDEEWANFLEVAPWLNEVGLVDFDC